MNKEDLILKGIKTILEGDYFPGAKDWIREYDEIYKINDEIACKMPPRDGEFVKSKDGEKKDE